MEKYADNATYVMRENAHISSLKIRILKNLEKRYSNIFIQIKAKLTRSR